MNEDPGIQALIGALEDAAGHPMSDPVVAEGLIAVKRFREVHPEPEFAPMLGRITELLYHALDFPVYTRRSISTKAALATAQQQGPKALATLRRRTKPD